MTRRSVPADRLAGLDDPRRGLTAGEASARRVRFGANDIVESPPGRWRALARETARDPMLWFLAATAVVYALVGERAEALTLLLAIVPLVGMDLFLHRRTQASTEALESRLAARAVVVREGGAVEVPALEVVPGDLSLVGPGQAFPADGLVVDGTDLQADESTLTGEAYPAAKRALAGGLAGAGDVAVPAEHWVFAGTRLLTGRAAVRVVYTGGETLYGEIVRSATAGARGSTPLQSLIQRLVGVLVAAAVVLCLVLAAVRLWQGYGWVDALVSAVTLASAALPEEFPLVFTFFLGVGVFRLARCQALVRRAVCIESIGRVTTICSDKTGTITEGRLSLGVLEPAEAVSPARVLALAAAASRPDGADPLDLAIVAAAAAEGGWPGPARVLRRFPFTEARRRETAIVRLDDGATAAVTKGAAETVLALTSLDRARRDAWTSRVAALAADGFKVIACAWRPLDDQETPDEPSTDFRFAGLLAFEDAVREGVAEAVAICGAAGIHPVMVTGDHLVTARAVARRIGLGGDAPVVISGEDLDAGLVERGAAALRGVDVIARAAPAQKLTLVRALQAEGERVLVTGDGVNDVPALQAADVGVAMGERGTRSAREVAAIVLLDDNFRTIVRAIGEGRQLFRNLQLSFQYLLMIHVPLVVTAALLPLAGYPLLYLPIHIVWLELMIHPTALLAFQERPAHDHLTRAPAGTRFLSRRQWASTLVVGVWLTVLVTVGYVRSVQEMGDPEHGRALALAALALGSAAITAALSHGRTASAWVVMGASTALCVVLVQVPALAARLHLQPLHVDDWAFVLAGATCTGLLALAGRAGGARHPAPGRAPTAPGGRGRGG